MATGPMVRMNELDKVEKEVVSCLHTAGKALEEIGKDKPSQKQVDLLVTQFMNSLQEIDSKLTENIKYLSQVSTGKSPLNTDWSDIIPASIHTDTDLHVDLQICTL